MVRIVGWIVLTSVVVLVPMWWRANMAASAALDRAEELYQQGRYGQAIPAYRDALRWRAPFLSQFGIAEARLLALVARNDLDTTTQQAALEALSQGITASQSLFTARSDQERLLDLRQQLAVRADVDRESSSLKRVYPVEKHFIPDLLASIGCVSLLLLVGYGACFGVPQRWRWSYGLALVVTLTLWYGALYWRKMVVLGGIG